MSTSLVLIASAGPSLWQLVKETLTGRYAVAFSLDLAGTYDVLQRHQPALLLLCAKLLVRSRPEAIAQLARRMGSTRVVIITSPERTLAAEDREKLHQALSPAAWIMTSEIHRSLLPLADTILGRGGCSELRIARRSPEVAVPAITEPKARPSLDTAAAQSSPVYRPMVVGRSPIIQRVMEMARCIAAIDATVLLCGETGVGKELFARWLHCASPRRHGPFITADLPSIPDELFESILFGHEKGAFTGAIAPTQGKFQQAAGGTLFLDEISSLKLALQPKLLRVLQEKEVESVGGRGPTRCNVRIIAATNVNLTEAVKHGAFRADLFHRLNSFKITIPALRQRSADIDELCQFFSKKFTKEFGCPPLTMSREMLATLKAYHWPGNIRELENRIQRIMLLAQGNPADMLGEPVEDLVAEPDTERGICFGEEEHTLATIEQLYIQHVLERTRGNQSQAAQILGIDRKTLRAKMMKLCESSPPAMLRSV